MVRTLLGQKKGIRQVWTATGRRMPVTGISVGGNAVVRVISAPAEGEEGSSTVQIGFGPKKLKNLNNAQRQQLTQAGLEGKRWFQETETESTVQAGQSLPIQEVFHVGDIIKVTGSIKGRGFAGVMKRHGFKGGPRTHGQSDRARAPGSIGGRTTPGRVFPGMRMAGHYGGTTETLENRTIIAIDEATQTVWIKGTLPGAYNSFLTLRKQDSPANEIALNEASLELLGIKPVVETPVEEVEAETPVVAAAEQAEAAAPEVTETATAQENA